MKKKNYFSQKKSGSELLAKQDIRSMGGISLPTFPFEFSVEQASNRMIEHKYLSFTILHIAFFVLLLSYQGSNLKSSDPESDVLPITP